MGAYSRRSTRSSARIADSIAPSELQRLDKMNTLPPLSLTTTNHLTAGFLGWQDNFNSHRGHVRAAPATLVPCQGCRGAQM